MNIKNCFFIAFIVTYILTSCKTEIKKDEVKLIPQVLNTMTIPDYWEDPKVSEIGREEPRADFKAMESEAKALTNQYPSSKYYYNLNGFWKYQFFTGPSSVPADIEKSDAYSSWLDISMPGFAELKGMGKPIFKYYGLPFKLDYPHVPHDSNSVFILKKSFEISNEWNDRDIYAVFEGVSTSYFVYLNGEMVGYNEDTKACSEYNLNKYLKKGLNDLTLVLIRWTDGSYFETHNQWSLTGINRNSYLLARPKLKIKDYFAQSNLLGKNGTLDIETEISNSTLESKYLNLEAKILDQQTRDILASKNIRISINKSQSIKNKFSLSVNSINPWSSEIPITYDLIINLKNDKNEIIESASSKVAFTSISYKNNFLINNKDVKIKGVTCHEFHPIAGNILSKEWIDNDMDVMKLHNINAIRNNHYPFDSYWYQSSLKYGLYIMDECNLDLTALSKQGIDLSKDSSASKIYLQRVKNTFERNKNYGHIFAWTLGYNTGSGENIKKAYEYIKSRDHKRPSSCMTGFESFGDLDYSSNNLSSKCNINYCIGSNHGNGLGGFTEKWDKIMNDPKCGGGFVEDFTDQCFYMKNKSGQLFFGYGGVFGENKSDSF
ncbi:MAG: glycoside hydrolase family 2 TIM barrel-domain containing protein, partial [Saprospiraceae bacterium]